MFQYPFMCSKTFSTSLDGDCELMRPAQEAGIVSPGARCNEHNVGIAELLWSCWIEIWWSGSIT